MPCIVVGLEGFKINHQTSKTAVVLLLKANKSSVDHIIATHDLRVA